MNQVLEIWKRSPLLRIVVPLVIGVVASDIPFLGWFLSSVIFLLSAWFFAQSGINRHWSRSRYLFLEGIFYSALSALAGVLLVEVRRPAYDDLHIMHEWGMSHVLAVRLEDEPKQTATGWRVVADAIAAQEEGRMRPLRGRLSLLLSDSLHQRMPHADDVVWVQSTVESIAAPKNPVAFDFSRYSARQGIYASVHAREQQWLLDSCNRVVTWRGRIVRLRERLLTALEAAPMEPRERHVLAALVLGKTTELDAELMQAYATAGAVHVLAVSGLHVALIYILLKPLFSFVFGKRRAKWLRWSIPVVLLWVYAALTGFSPSVLRAALMFSCFIVGETYGKTGNIFNTMSASVIILLLIDPMVLYSMGFLLSYLAVLGIVVLQPPLRKLVAPQSFLLKKAWELVTISVAAQVATMPVTLYMFHQFPTWFIVTNLVVVPLSTVVLYTALAFFVLLWWMPGASFIGGLLGLLTRIMNDMMTWSAQWPHAVIDGIYWSVAELWWCLALIVFSSCAFLFRIRKAWFGVMAVSVVWILYAAIGEVQRASNATLCFFSVRSHDLCTSIAEGVACSYRDNGRSGAMEAFNRTVLPFIQSNHVRHTCIFGPCDEVRSDGITVVQEKLKLRDVEVVKVDSLGSCFSQGCSSDAYWFTCTANRLYLREEQLALLRGKTVILGNTYSRKKRAWLKQQLSAVAWVFDLTESAVIWEGGRWYSFRSE